MFQGPTKIGRYRVIGELGRGSMGIVYLAEDPALKRQVAIKLVLQGTASQEEALARFRKEAEISARLNHPNVIMVFDVGEEEGLGPFMAMEYADGEVLAHVLERGPLAPDEAAQVLIQGFHALQAAHENGIIHRDFKPENLILTRNGRLKLMDFGIARQENPARTGSGVVCTPNYAAPELLDGKTPSPQTDNWAFCVMAFQMLAGQVPFQGTTISSLLWAIAHEPHAVPPGFPVGLDDLFQKAFQKDPAARHPDLRTFMLDLLDALSLDPEVRGRCMTLMEASDPSGAVTRILPPLPRSPVFPVRVWWMAASVVILLFAGVWAFRVLTARTLTVTAYPPHVQVYLDDVSLGTTPLIKARIPSKAQRIRLEKDGYQTVERLLGPDEAWCTFSLQVQPVTLAFQSQPQGAEVFVNNALVGLTPLKGLELPGDQSHQVQLRKAGYEVWIKDFGPGEKPQGVIELRRLEPPKRSFWQRLFGRK